MDSQNKTLARLDHWSSFTTFVLIFLACGNVPLARAQNDCKFVFDAGDKVTMTPHHGYTTTTLQTGQKLSNGEAIFVGGVIYVRIHDQWKKSPMTVQDMQKQEQENRKETKNVSCRHVRDEAVNGEAAGVYSAHAETEDMKTDSLIWISRSTGLILRQEEDLDSDSNKSHVSVRYEYRNVSAPAVSP